MEPQLYKLSISQLLNQLSDMKITYMEYLYYEVDTSALAFIWQEIQAIDAELKKRGESYATEYVCLF